MHERAEFLDQHAATPAILRALVWDLPDDAWRRGGEGNDAWSIVEVVCHLRDAEENALWRTLRVRDEEQPLIPAYDQAELAISARYREQSPADALDAFEAFRAEQIKVLAALDDAQWQRTGVHEIGGQFTIESQVAHMAWHDANHLAQIARRIHAVSAARSGSDATAESAFASADQTSELTERTALYQLVDGLSGAELHAARRFLEYLTQHG